MRRLRRTTIRFSFLSFCLFLISSLFLTSCTLDEAPSILSNDPPAGSNYVLVTPNGLPTATPFQPSANTPLPTFTPIPLVTDTPVPTAIPTDTPAPTVAATEATADTSGPPPVAGNKPQYLLSVLMDYGGHSVTVSETIIYPNTSGDALPSLLLGVNPMLWTNVFHLQSVLVNDQIWSNFTLSGQALTVNLGAPLQPGQAVKIGIGYNLLLPYSNGKFENFGYTARQTTLLDWYPFVAPYIAGQGWVLPDPYPYGENLVYPEADFRVSLTFADPVNPPVVAASAPGSFENGALVYNLPDARNFTITASYEYQVSTTSANGVTIYNYYFPEDANAAAMVQQLTMMAVNTYSSAFGPYVHGALSVVETDLNDGLETDGLYFLARSFYRSYDGTAHNNLGVIAVHETAHQWWYGAVANNQATEPWLDEALATYSEHVFYETNYPSLVNWWWNFRVNYYNPSGYVDSRVYDTGSFRSYVNAVYFNGANFLDALRLRIGDAAFFAFLQDYYARERGGISSAGAFFYILDQHATADYSDLVRTYFRYR